MVRVHTLISMEAKSPSLHYPEESLHSSDNIVLDPKRRGGEGGTGAVAHPPAFKLGCVYRLLTTQSAVAPPLLASTVAN